MNASKSEKKQANKHARDLSTAYITILECFPRYFSRSELLTNVNPGKVNLNGAIAFLNIQVHALARSRDRSIVKFEIENKRDKETESDQLALV